MQVTPDLPSDGALIFIELGAVAVALALLARLAGRIGLSAIPLYLVAGLAFGNGGIAPLQFSETFVHVGADIGVLLLLFMLGLEYTADELRKNLRSAAPAGAVDFALNFTPGVVAGLAFGWSPLAAVMLGGVTWISSTGVIARVISELKRKRAPETPTVLSVLVLEDIAMAVYLPLVTVLLSGGGVGAAVVSIGVALATVATILLTATRLGKKLNQFASNSSDEVLLFTTLGLVLLIAGVAQQLHVSAGVGAFLVGIAISGQVARRARQLVRPLRDLFAAAFFLFFGLETNPRELLSVLGPAIALAAVTAATKVATGWWAARRAGLEGDARWRAGLMLTARGEFSIVIAGLAMHAGIEPRIGPVSAAYVLILAIAGPILARLK